MKMALSFFVLLTSFFVMIQGDCFAQNNHKSTMISEHNPKQVDILLLFALPASGKSEIRRYLSNLTPEERLQKYGIKNNIVQIDDFPYVFMMRRISEELVSMKRKGAFFLSPALPFRDPFEWATLMELINEDYRDFVYQQKFNPESASLWLFDRLDQARSRAGLIPAIGQLSENVVNELAKRLEKDARKLLDSKNAQIPSSMKDLTLFVEFSRGGADGSPFPLPAPYGYQFALSKLNPGMLKKASILYISISPEEARRKNEARADPNDPGSILHHGVPRAVMYTDYGNDDIDYLLKVSDMKNHICITQKGEKYYIPVAYFNNRGDLTSFLREDVARWNKKNLSSLEGSLERAFFSFNKKG